jgi:hypothetical protein
MKTKIDNSLSAPRIFTYEQLARISDANFEIFNQNIDPMKIDKMGTFVLTPVMLHCHAFGKPIKPHLRALVREKDGRITCGLQDLTFDQFRTGIVAA